VSVHATSPTCYPEICSSGTGDLEAIGRIVSDKKVVIGVIDHHTLQIERPDQVADIVREALKHTSPERIVISSDCGMGIMKYTGEDTKKPHGNPPSNLPGYPLNDLERRGVPPENPPASSPGIAQLLKSSYIA
jgi:hypothetical protein